MYNTCIVYCINTSYKRNKVKEITIMNLTWFYFHCVLAIIIFVKDYNGTLEGALDRFEKKIGLYTEVDTTYDETPPFYIPPKQEEQEEESVIDSNFVNIK